MLALGLADCLILLDGIPNAINNVIIDIDIMNATITSSVAHGHIMNCRESGVGAIPALVIRTLRLSRTLGVAFSRIDLLATDGGLCYKT